MVGTDLQQLLARALSEPLREPRVVLRARELRKARIGDLPDEQVLEAVGRLAGDRGARLAQQELPHQEVVEQHVYVLEVGREVRDGALPEHPSDDRSALKQRLRGRGQVVDPRRDQRLQGVRDAVGATVVSALDEHPDGLLHKEWIALGAREHLAWQRRGRRNLLEQLLDEEEALVLGQRLELDRCRPHTAAAPAGPRVEKLGPSEAEDEQRRPNPVGHVLDQVEERLLRPVDVLEEEDERLDVGERLHDVACRPRDLLRAPLALEGFEHTRGEPEDVGDRLLLAARAELLERLLERIVVRDAGRGLDHLGERPVRHAFPVGKTASREDACALESVEKLAREPTLAHARLAVDREEMRAAVAGDAREGVLEKLELCVPADERGPRAEWTSRAVDGVDETPRT